MQPFTFEQYLQSKGLSEGVIKRYRAEMRRHRQFLHLLGKTPEGATKKDLLDYLQSEERPISRYQVVRKRPLSNRTKQGILSVLNHYYGYLMQQGLVAQNLTQFIRIRGIKSGSCNACLLRRSWNSFASCCIRRPAGSSNLPCSSKKTICCLLW